MDDKMKTNEPEKTKKGRLNRICSILSVAVGILSFTLALYQHVTGHRFGFGQDNRESVESVIPVQKTEREKEQGAEELEKVFKKFKAVKTQTKSQEATRTSGR